MVNLNLEENEGIILQKDSVGKYTENSEEELEELILTNKNLIQVHEISTGLFSKEKYFINKISLSEIRVINGKTQVSIIHHVDYGITLQLILINGDRILYDLNGSPTKVFPKWEKAISDARLNFVNESTKARTIVKEELIDDEIKSTNQEEFESKNTEKTDAKYCSSCGGVLDKGALFCKHCGFKLGEEVDKTNKRKEFYDGKVAKCPQCGEILDSFISECPSCGYEIRGRERISVVHELSLKIEKTDNEKKKDELIRNFYIPNTKEDIYEFFILAISHIKIGGTNTDSWMVKLEQAYQKANLIIADNNELERLVPLYNEAQVLNKKNSSSSFFKSFINCFKSGYAWALLFLVVGLFFTLFSTSIGMGFIAAAMWIALLYMINNEKKNKIK